MVALLTYNLKDIDDCLYSRDKGVDKMMYNKTEQVHYTSSDHINPYSTN